MPEVARLKIAGVSTGTSGGYIEIYSWSWGASNSTTVGSPTGGAGSGKVSLSDLTVTKKVDQATPALAQLALQGTPISNLMLVVQFGPGEGGGAGGSGGGIDTLTVNFLDAVISGYKIDGGRPGQPSTENGPCPPSEGGGGGLGGGIDAGGFPMESISFTFLQLNVQFQQQT